MNGGGFGGNLSGSARRAVILACAAANTAAFVDGRAHIARFGLYHRDCIGRTVACTVAAVLAVCGRNAYFRIYYCRADFNRRFFFSVNRFYGAGRTDVCACRALRAAKALGENHDGLHEIAKSGRRFENSVGAGADT